MRRALGDVFATIAALFVGRRNDVILGFKDAQHSSAERVAVNLAHPAEEAADAVIAPATA